MTNRKILFPLFFLSVLFSMNLTVTAQQKKNNPSTSKSTPNEPSSSILTAEELVDYKKRVASLVSFYEFALNTIGSDASAAEDKEIIINKSYAKFFVSNKVQIEDDLDANRLVKTYKPVQAYLQDVDYFFKNVQFEYNIEEITPFIEGVNQPYFKVTLTRFLKGKNNDGDTVFNNQKRYIEVNLDIKQKDIKIASIYTTLMNEEEEQTNWWKNLSEPWKQIFKKEMGGLDSLNYGQIKRLQNTQELSLIGNKQIMDLSPLTKFTALKVLNISETNIFDLSPLRNLLSLEELNVDGTLVKNFSELKYATKIKVLSFNNTSPDSVIDLSRLASLEQLSCGKTKITSLDFISPLKSLKYLDLANNAIANLKAISATKQLEHLNLSNTEVNDLEEISKLTNLKFLNLSNTKIKQLGHIETLLKLEKILFNNTAIQTLDDLKTIPNLQKIYCDNTQINRVEAIQFMKLKPKVLVIFETQKLQKWWIELPEVWKVVFRKYIKVSEVPTIEQLTLIANIEEIELPEKNEINSIEPLKFLYQLKNLILNSSLITSLEPLIESIFLEQLNISNNKIRSLVPILKLNNIKFLYCENTLLDSAKINTFRDKNPKSVVIYRTAYLRDWWVDVSEDWRNLFKKYIPYTTLPSDEQLHQIIALDSIFASDMQGVSNLIPILKMDRIRFLKLTNCRISNLQPLSQVQTLLHLDLTKNPIKDLSPISKLEHLERLILSNTGINDLEPIAPLKNITELNLSGTQINELEAIEKYAFLKYLDISSTMVSSLKSLEGNTSLVTLKCYNTKLTEKKIAKFKLNNPKCEVDFY